MNLAELAKEINKVNRDNGWNVDYDWGDQYQIPAMIMLICTEIHEAKYGKNKEEEFADIAIRILSLVESYDIGRLIRAQQFIEPSTVGYYEKAYKHCCVAVEYFRHDQREFVVIQLARLYVNTMAMLENDYTPILQKIDKNRSRPFRHGGKKI